MKIISMLLFALLVSSCSGYAEFYKSYLDAKKLKNVALLKQYEEPEIYSTKDFGIDRRKLLARKYIAIGFASFNGKYEGEDRVIEQARSVGATLVLIKSKFTGTQTTTTNLYLPDNKTTYHSGTGSGNTTYNSAYGQILGNSSTNLSYSGTSTTYGTKAVPITTHQRRYDQAAMFFVKSTKKLKFGVQTRDLTDEQKAALERNSGARVFVVFEDSPAFYANVSQDDILLKINDTAIRSSKHASEVMGNVPANNKSATYTVLRKGKEKIIKIMFDKNTQADGDNSKSSKTPPLIFGANVVSMSGELRARLKVKNGLLVKSITKNSPAFDASLLKGDILLQIGNVGIDDLDTLNLAIKVYNGKAVSIIVNREGSILKKIITF